MRYTWTPEKNRQNLAKHGVAFEDVVAIFPANHYSVEVIAL